MTDKELKEKILAEIENLEKEAPYENPAQELGYQFALEDVIDYINSLPEEPVSEGLEEEQQTNMLIMQTTFMQM